MVYSSPPLKEKDIESFIEARYSGDTSTVNLMIDKNFQYHHIPYIGLGVDAHYVDGSLLISSVVNDSIQDLLVAGDRIFELNGRVVDSTGLKTLGPVGEEQHLIINKKNDSTFTELKIPLKQFQYIEDGTSFLKSIDDYSNRWYDFDIEIIDLFSKKNKTVVHYYWEGSKKEEGSIFSFTAIEIITLNKKKSLIERVEGLWSEKQFRDQFK